uniref:Uncharacterized protein n=1 Tax=Arundo donax TaxID=35708 RepID=A0A0A9GRE4_ARUDO
MLWLCLFHLLFQILNIIQFILESYYKSNPVFKKCYRNSRCLAVKIFSPCGLTFPFP